MSYAIEVNTTDKGWRKMVEFRNTHGDMTHRELYDTADRFKTELIVAAVEEFGEDEVDPKDCDEHDEYMIHSANHWVYKDDILYILGDFCKEKPGRYRQLLRCKNIHFILGNHDQPAKIRNVFGGNVWDNRMVTVKGEPTRKVWCCHYPTAFWDQCFRGSYHVYGHLHNDKKREAMMDLGMPGRRSMDVGVDHAYERYGEYRPFSATAVFNILRHRGGHDMIPEKEYGR
ncbi:MAG: hypothetical protein ACYS7Y_36805 [Planctomycetota bacterium]